jgi:hypothetical protein
MYCIACAELAVPDEEMKAVKNIYELGLRLAFTAAFVLTLAMLFSSQSARAADVKLTADWQGTYYYPTEVKQAPVPFQLHLTWLSRGEFSGKSTEPATFGTQPCTNLSANVSGRVVGKIIEFTKTYDGTCGQTHSVFYSGTLGPDNRAMDGRWSVSANFGGIFNAAAQ